MYRTVAQLDALTAQLAQNFPQLCTRVLLPEESVQHRPVYALLLRAGGGGERRGVLLVGGTHARELMNPDMLVELAVDLITTYLTGNDLVLGNRTWPAPDLKMILDTLDIYLLPCSNPDGREYAMTVDDLWRKNLRNNKGSQCDGVDQNRNADFVWGVLEGPTSCDPCSDPYVGESPFSEPETRNVKHLLDTHPIDCFADVHSYSELVLYPWGHAGTQTTDPSKRFTNLPTGTCQPLGMPGYQEYMSSSDLSRFQSVGQRVVDEIAAVRGRVYTNEPSIGLYPTTGTQSDYAYGRHIADPALRKVFGYTIETGPWVGDPRESFHPANPEPIKQEARSGMIALMRSFICSIELVGASMLGRTEEVDTLRQVRDERLARTRPGQAWVSLFERAQVPLLDVVLRDERLAGQAADLLVRAGALVSDEKARLDPEVLDAALSFSRALEEHAPTDEVRADLRAVAAQLEASQDQLVGEFLQSLTDKAPETDPSQTLA